MSEDKKPVVEFHPVGTKVICTGKSDGGTDLSGQKAVIVTHFLRDSHTNLKEFGYSYDYRVKILPGHTRSGGIFEMIHERVSVLRTATLYAYEDNKNEVHWTTKPYSESKAKREKLVAKPEFNKYFDLE